MVYLEIVDSECVLSLLCAVDTARTGRGERGRQEELNVGRHRSC